MKLVTKDGKLLVGLGGLKTSEADNPDCEECCGGKPCGQVATSGGNGITVDEYPMPDKEGEVVFAYNSLGVPDAFKVEGGGKVFVDTGMVSTGDFRQAKFCKPKGLRKLTVTVTGGNGTVWLYQLGCPDSPCDPNGYPQPQPARYVEQDYPADPPLEQVRAILQLEEEARAGKAGVGTELAAILGFFWIKAEEGCKCHDRKVEMNLRGPDWCRENLELISSWLAEGARDRGIPYVELLGRMAIQKAISNWETKRMSLRLPGPT